MEFQKEFDKGVEFDRQFSVHSSTFLQELGASVGVRDFEHHKSLFDSDLRHGDFRNIRSAIVWLRDVPDIVCAGPVSLDYDFQGNPIQADPEIEERLDYLSLTILATSHGGAAVFSWREDSGESAEKMVQSLFSLPGTAITNAIMRLVFTSMANLFMSIPWWDALPLSVKAALTSRMVESAHPDYEVGSDVLLDDGFQPVSWRIAGIQTRWD